MQPFMGLPGLPEALSFLGKGRKQILPIGKSWAEGRSPLLFAEPMQMRYAPLN